ncbi:hypothetical protein [Serinibacter salmoneus]|uniref:Head-to-tail stopper n=1 Tax=Serinibacter salmoneus TaxID=556530 RepID=A0A2A9D0F6_9MICO|nr:hypothetical protein [Serinibacter salmoneus]PFG19871.1 hypothetical protein ATL40_1447 [Serinibacter salmoneus]
MSFWDLHTRAVTVTSTTYGEPGPTGVPTMVTTPRVIEGVNVQQVGTSESVGSQTLVTGRWRVSCPALALWVQPGDPVTLDGDSAEYFVEGEPAHLRGGVLDHTEFVVSSRRKGA